LSTAAAADARLEQRISFDVLFAVIFLVVLHGLSAIKIVVILYLNFAIATKLPRQYVPAMTWLFNVGVLFANELCRGYSYASVLSVLLPGSPVSEKQEPATNFGHTLDSYGGLIPRWEVLFNFTVLRLISFNLDYYWSLNSKVGSPLEVR
jgi:protein-cysteine N-palmitoyltransferase HHAT